MKAAQVQLDASARNVANMETAGYQRRVFQQTTQSNGGASSQVFNSMKAEPSLETDVVNQLQAKNRFLANLSVFKTGNAMMGSLLDQKA